MNPKDCDDALRIVRRVLEIYERNKAIRSQFERSVKSQLTKAERIKIGHGLEKIRVVLGPLAEDSRALLARLEGETEAQSGEQN